MDEVHGTEVKIEVRREPRPRHGCALGLVAVTTALAVAACGGTDSGDDDGTPTVPPAEDTIVEPTWDCPIKWSVALAIEVVEEGPVPAESSVQPCTNVERNETYLRNVSSFVWVVDTDGGPIRRIPADRPEAQWLTFLSDTPTPQIRLAPSEALVVGQNPSRVSWELDQPDALVALLQQQMMQKVVDDVESLVEGTGRQILTDIYAGNSPMRRALATCWFVAVDVVEDDLPRYQEDDAASRLLASLASARKARICAEEWSESIDDLKRKYQDEYPRLATLADDFNGFVEDARWIKAVDDEAARVMRYSKAARMVARAL